MCSLVLVIVLLPVYADLVVEGNVFFFFFRVWSLHERTADFKGGAAAAVPPIKNRRSRQRRQRLGDTRPA